MQVKKHCEWYNTIKETNYATEQKVQVHSGPLQAAVWLLNWLIPESLRKLVP